MTADERRVAERRTLALRGPGAGGFTPPQSLAASNPCLNCGTNVQLEYCPECGQRVFEADPTLKEFLHDAAQELLHWDGKLAITFRTLVTKPGVLTIEYLAGRRIRYISPLRVYLTCSVLFFFIAAMVPNRTGTDRSGRQVERGVVQVGQATDQELAQLDAEARASSPIRRFWLTRFARASRTPAELQRATTAAIPKAMFLLVPVFAALVGLVYRDRRRRYPQHLAFALHVHAALFLALLLTLAGRVIPSLIAGAVYQLVIAIPFAIYVVRATRAVYDGSTTQAVWRLTLASAMYFIAFLGTLLVVLAGTVLRF